jgi:hypothetical protein
VIYKEAKGAVFVMQNNKASIGRGAMAEQQGIGRQFTGTVPALHGPKT